MKSYKRNNTNWHRPNIKGGHNVIHMSETGVEAVSKIKHMINSREYEQKFGTFTVLICTVIRELDKDKDMKMLKESERYILYILSRNSSNMQLSYESLEDNVFSLMTDLIEILKTYEYIIIRVTGYTLHNDIVKTLLTVSKRYEVKHENRDSI